MIKQTKGFIGFPKGHVEKDETEIETAIREIKEETNIDVKVDTNFRTEISYLIKEKNVIKERSRRANKQNDCVILESISLKQF